MSATSVPVRTFHETQQVKVIEPVDAAAHDEHRGRTDDEQQREQHGDDFFRHVAAVDDVESVVVPDLEQGQRRKQERVNGERDVCARRASKIIIIVISDDK